MKLDFSIPNNSLNTGVILLEVPTPPFISLAAAADEKHLITAEDLCL